ncbi:MAG: arylsulfatase [Planctomycetota bacterium]
MRTRCVFALCAALAACASQSAHAPRLNVVIVLADDLGAGDLHCYNADSKAPTPVLDRVAAESMRFLDAHSPSAVCSPTRYGLLTGRYAWRTRMKSWVLNGDSRLLIEPGRPTLASTLHDAGYVTACFGKWHLGLGAFDPARPDLEADYSAAFDAGPHTVGFDVSRVIPASLDMPPYLWVENGTVVIAATAHTPGSKRRWDGGEGFWREGPIAPDFHIDEVLHQTCTAAVDFVHAQRDGARPFFLYLPLTAPHTPWVPDAAHQGTSRAGWYGDFVAQVDTEIGRVLDALDAIGARDDTLLIVTSDNGAHWRHKDVHDFGHDAHDGRRGMKADVHEAGHRIPLLVRWPGHIAAGSTTDALVSLVDLLPTCAAMTATPLADGASPDGVSFAAVLRDADAHARDDVVLHSGDGMFGLRAGNWVFVEGLGSGGFTAPARVKPGQDGVDGQLYDLATDPHQEHDLFATQPAVVARLRARLDAIRAQRH